MYFLLVFSLLISERARARWVLGARVLARFIVSMQLSDQELVIACRRGEPLAWDTLVERYQRLVYAIPLRVGLTADDAADVFQAVFVSLLEHLDSLDRPQGLAKWLISTAQRESWRVCRNRVRESAEDRDLALLPDETASPEIEVGNAVDQELALAALEQVGTPCRELLRCSISILPSLPMKRSVADFRCL